MNEYIVKKYNTMNDNRNFIYYRIQNMYISDYDAIIDANKVLYKKIESNKYGKTIVVYSDSFSNIIKLSGFDYKDYKKYDLFGDVIGIIGDIFDE